ncbi:hypothetical protein C2S51_038756 [Perilla frutescens var. frutescens]|nr:hypothetical protein C2S51_038756 [Perilla frutescens var. frutescens]
MVSFSNGTLSGEISNKRPLENGCMPKFKPRKVSAVRDFPPGCGPNAVPVNLRPEDISGSGAGSTDALGVMNLEKTKVLAADGDETSVMADLVRSEAVGNSEMPEVAKLSEVKHSEIQDVMGCQSCEEDGSQTSLSFQHWADVPVPETLDTLMEKAKENVTVSKKLVTEIGPLGTQLPGEAESHIQEAVNNPIEMERDEQLGLYVGEVETTVTSGLTNEVREVTPEPDLVGVNIVNDLKSLDHSGGQTMLEELKEDNCLASCQKLLGNPLAFSPSCGNIQPETSIRPKDKYRPRRVSAVRDFPPYCGINVSLPIEEGKEMATQGKDSLNRTEGIESEPSTSANVSEREMTGEMLRTSGECVDGFHDVHVEMEKSETLNDGAGRGLLGEISVATERTEASPGSGTSIKDARGPAGIENAVLSPDRNDKDRPLQSGFSFGNDFNRELVHGLMAAPYCPWRKSKAALNSPDGGTDGPKLRQQNVPLQQKPKADALNSNLEANSSGYPSLTSASPDSHDGDETPGKLTLIGEGDHGTCSKSVPEVTPVSMFKNKVDNSDNDCVEPLRKDIVDYSPADSDEGRNSHDAFPSKDDVDREVVHGLMAAPYCPWRKEKTVSNSNGGTSGGKKRKHNLSWRQKAKAVARKSNPGIQFSGPSSKKKNKVHISYDVGEESNALILVDDGDHDHHEDFITNSPSNSNRKEFEISLPHVCPNSSGPVDARKTVRDTLRLFHAIYRKLLQEEEANPVQGEEGRSRLSGKKGKRIDLITAQVLKEKKKIVNTDKMVGPVPGVEVGDEFQYRVELAVVGIHFPYQSGIDSMKVNEVPLATSIVASGAYFDDVENADVLRYSGQGGNVVGKSKKPEDQKMERGNLALKNCIDAKTPVRVVRGWREMKYVDPQDSKPKLVTTYVYDGLYTVTNYSTERGPHGKKVFMFELKRNPGQPELAWKELKNKSKIRPGVCVTDLSGGKELVPICAVNTLDDSKPPSFNYVPKMMYPDWYFPTPPEGCNCSGKCSDSKKCLCAVRNGGKIPYTHGGALVETKTLVYECGPHCKCPPSCYNRVTQRGIKFQLEVFKTESRGWGVRALSSISPGSFICEYTGELLEEKEADERIGNDEYLFDIGQNLIDSSTNPEEQESPVGLNVKKGYTIDALSYGNVGRFINHSCSPNLYAQNVIYDNDDKRAPHIMLVALENIPPLKELTYHYNYSLDQIYDSEGNIKVKDCYCGAADCNGRMY